MDVTELRHLIDQGEGPKTEFKANFPEQSHKLAKEMVAFANSGGGILLLGVQDDGSIIGVAEPSRAEERLANIARSCKPPLWPIIEKIFFENNECVISATIPSAAVTLYDGRAYIRVGTTSVECGGGAEFRSLLENLNEHDRTNRLREVNNRSTLNDCLVATSRDVISRGWTGTKLL